MNLVSIWQCFEGQGIRLHHSFWWSICLSAHLSSQKAPSVCGNVIYGCIMLSTIFAFLDIILEVKHIGWLWCLGLCCVGQETRWRHLFWCQSVYLSICLSSVSRSICPPFSQSVHSSVCLTVGLVWFGLVWCCLMTSGLSRDIQCHVWPYFF